MGKVSMGKVSNGLSFRVGVNRLIRDVGFYIKKGERIELKGWVNAGNIGVYDVNVIASIPTGTVLTLEIAEVRKSVLFTTGLEGDLKLIPCKCPEDWNKIPIIKLNENTYLDMCKKIRQGSPMTTNDVCVKLS